MLNKKEEQSEPNENKLTNIFSRQNPLTWNLQNIAAIFMHVSESKARNQKARHLVVFIRYFRLLAIMEKCAFIFT